MIAQSILYLTSRHLRRSNKNPLPQNKNKSVQIYISAMIKAM